MLTFIILMFRFINQYLVIPSLCFITFSILLSKLFTSLLQIDGKIFSYYFRTTFFSLAIDLHFWLQIFFFIWAYRCSIMLFCVVWQGALFCWNIIHFFFFFQIFYITTEDVNVSNMSSKHKIYIYIFTSRKGI